MGQLSVTFRDPLLGGTGSLSGRIVLEEARATKFSRPYLATAAHNFYQTLGRMAYCRNDIGMAPLLSRVPLTMSCEHTSASLTREGVSEQ